MYGERSTQVLALGRMTVHTNLEAVAIILATGLSGSSWLDAALIVGSFAFGTGLHLASHLLVAVAFGKGIDRMVLTRAGRIDYSGAPPRFGEAIARTAAGASTNALCAIISYLILTHVEVGELPDVLALALQTFARCSLILTIVNFLPAVPLDGGLILRALLDRVIGESTADRASTLVSFVLLTTMAVIGVVFVQPVLVYMGLAITYDNWRKLRLHASDPARSVM